MERVIRLLGVLLFVIYSISLAQAEIEQIKTDLDNGVYALAANISGPKAIEIYPNNPDAHFLYAYSLYLLSKYDTARLQLNIALNLNSQYNSSYENLNGLLLASEGDTYLARQVLKKAFEKNRKYEFAMDWAKVAWQSGHFDEAIDAFRLAALTSKGKTEGWPMLNIGRILHSQNDFEKAIEAYKKAISLFDAQDNAIGRSSLPSPGYVETFFQLGRIYEELGDVKRAKAYYNSAKNSDPDLVAARVALERLEESNSP